SGQVVLLPNNMIENKQGILFQNLKCYRNYLINDRFPIDNPKQAVYERHQTDLINIKGKIDEILNHLNTIVNGDTIITNSDNKKLIFFNCLAAAGAAAPADAAVEGYLDLFLCVL
ncbi:MAG TPA: hypothetical protein VHC48_09780, partial [Puia sp.]|nr:hypothetical protein [Puia sp.]